MLSFFQSYRSAGLHARRSNWMGLVTGDKFPLDKAVDPLPNNSYGMCWEVCRGGANVIGDPEQTREGRNPGQRNTVVAWKTLIHVQGVEHRGRPPVFFSIITTLH